MATFVHFEIPADNVERARQFYSRLFGWKIEKMQGPFEYWSVTTSNESDMPGIHGGMMKRQEPQQQMINYASVPSIEEYSAKVQALGGKIVVSKTPVPGMGYFAVCLDTEHNAFGLWTSDQNAR